LQQRMMRSHQHRSSTLNKKSECQSYLVLIAAYRRQNLGVILAKKFAKRINRSASDHHHQCVVTMHNGTRFA